MPRRHGARNGVTCITNFPKGRSERAREALPGCIEKWTAFSRVTDATAGMSPRGCLLSGWSSGPLRASFTVD
jgi:hypothetical protein